jgi:hypothetical protein
MGSATGFTVEFEKESVNKAVAVCIPAPPVTAAKSSEAYYLVNWWYKWKHNIALYFRKLNTSSSVFLVSGVRTTPKYANCCHTNNSMTTKLTVIGAAPVAIGTGFSFEASCKVEEVNRAFGFQFGEHKADQLPWVVFMTKHPSNFWGPLRRLKMIMLSIVE